LAICVVQFTKSDFYQSRHNTIVITMTSIFLENTEHQQLSPASWRLVPGYSSDSGSDVESVHILLGLFLTDRNSAEITLR